MNWGTVTGRLLLLRLALAALLKTLLSYRLTLTLRLLLLLLGTTASLATNTELKVTIFKVLELIDE